MAPLRIIYLASLGILGLVLVAIIYFIPSESTKYKETTRSELIKLEDGWVVQMDLNNANQMNEEKYNISVKVDDTEVDTQEAFINPDSKFRYSYGATPEEGKSVFFKIYRDNGDSKPYVQEFYQKL